jgi:hypothetical protein
VKTVAWSTPGIIPATLEHAMSGKNKGGREAKKPKQAKAAKITDSTGLITKVEPTKRPK